MNQRVTVVVDASFAIKWVLWEEHTEDALALLDEWENEFTQVFAPPIFRSEVTNILHRRALRGQITRAYAVELLESIITRVGIHEPDGLYARALTLAGELEWGAAYDAQYLALAESEDCDFWTADQRMVRSARRMFPRLQLKLIGEDSTLDS